MGSIREAEGWAAHSPFFSGGTHTIKTLPFCFALVIRVPLCAVAGEGARGFGQKHPKKLIMVIMLPPHFREFGEYRDLENIWEYLGYLRRY